MFRNHRILSPSLCEYKKRRGTRDIQRDGKEDSGIVELGDRYNGGLLLFVQNTQEKLFLFVKYF